VARPAWDVKQARETAGYRQVALGRVLGLADYTFDRIERSLITAGSTATADAIIAALPTLPARAQFELRSLLRRKQAHWIGLRLPGNGNGCPDTPTTPYLEVTGPLELRAEAALNTWGDGSTFQAFISKRNTALDAYQLRVNPDGTLGLLWWSGGVTRSVSSTLPLGFAPGSLHVVSGCVVPSTGAYLLRTSEDGGNHWTTVGSGITTPGAIDATAAPLRCGAGIGGNQAMTGILRWAEVRAGQDGGRLARFDGAQVTVTSPVLPATTPVLPINLFSANESSVESSLPALFLGESATGVSTWDNTAAYDGTSSVLLTAATPAGGRASFDVHPAGPPSGYFTVIAGQTYTFVCHCKGLALVKPFNGKINFSSNTTFLTSVAGVNPNNSLSVWTTHVVSAVAPPGATRAAPGCDIRNTITGDQANFDGFAFFDGAEAEWRPVGDIWTLTAGAGWSWVEAAA